ncbi:unnamed protein product [Arctogadus glacialis]
MGCSQCVNHPMHTNLFFVGPVGDPSTPTPLPPSPPAVMELSGQARADLALFLNEFRKFPVGGSFFILSDNKIGMESSTTPTIDCPDTI